MAATENQARRFKRMRKAFAKSADISTESLEDSQIITDFFEEISQRDSNHQLEKSSIQTMREELVKNMQTVFEEICEQYKINKLLSDAEEAARQKNSMPKLRVMEEGVTPEDMVREKMLEAKLRHCEQLKALVAEQNERNKKLEGEINLKQQKIIDHVMGLEKHKTELQQLVKIFQK